MKLINSMLAIAATAPLLAETTPAPNIVLMLIDDQGWTDFSGMSKVDSHGNTVYKSTDTSNSDIDFYTPNLATLSNESVIFTQAYAEPVCAPTRANIMTGLFPTRHHMYTVTNPGDTGKQLGRRQNEKRLATEFTTIAEVLTDSGYTCAHLGKWHLGDGTGDTSPIGQGFSYNKGGGMAGQPPGGKVTTLGPLYQDSDGNPVDPETGEWRGGTYWANYQGEFESLTGLPANGKPGQYLTDRLTEDSINIMNEANNAVEKKPFFIHLAHYGVHAPNAAKIEDLIAIEDEYQRLDPSYVRTVNVNSEPVDVSAKLLFAGMMKAVDRSVGDILNYLETTDDARNPGYKLIDNTMFIYISDNGGTVKSDYPPLKGKKCLAYEGGVRVPLMIKWKNKTAVREEMVNTTDFFPTFVQLTGATLPQGQILDGTNIMPLIEQTGTIANRGVFRHQPIHDRPMSTSVIYDNYKLIYFFETPNSDTYLGHGKYELYDLINDIGETTNLASEVDISLGNLGTQITDLTVREKFVELQQMLNNWLIDTNAELPYIRDENGVMTTETIKLPSLTDLPPVTDNKSLLTTENTAVSFSAPSRDKYGKVLTVSATSTPTNGEVTVSGNTVTYTPDSDFSGDDTFTYTLTSMAGSTSGTVGVTVSEQATPTTLIEATFNSGSDSNPTTATALNASSVGGSWSEPVIVGNIDMIQVNPTNGELDCDLTTSGSSVKTTFTFDSSKPLNGTDLEIKLSEYTRGGSGIGGCYVIGRDESNNELFKLFLSCGQKKPEAITNTSGLRRGVSYIDKNGEIVVVTTSDDVMQNGGIYKVSLTDSGYTYSGTPTSTGIPVTTPSEVEYNTENDGNLKSIELHIFNTNQNTGMEFDSITVSGIEIPNELEVTTTANFEMGASTNPTTASIMNESTIAGTWSEPLISGTVATNKVVVPDWQTDITVDNSSINTVLTLTNPLKLDGSTFEIDLTKYARAGAAKGGAYVTGKDSSGNELFKLFLSSGGQLPTGITLDSGSSLSNLRCGLGYITADNSCVLAPQPSGDFMRYGGLYSVTLDSDGFTYSATPDATGTTTALPKASYNSAGTDLATVELHIFRETQSAGYWIDAITFSEVKDQESPVSSVAGKTLSLTSSSSEITFNHEDLVTTAQGTTAGIADPTTGHWTCEFWIKLATSPDVDTPITITNSNRLNIGIRANNTIYIKNNGNLRSSNASITVGDWTHVAIIGNQLANGEIYINGVSQGSTSGAVNNGFRMSKLNPSNALGALGAEIDEIRVWTTARTEDQISSNMNKTFNSPYRADLALYYNFDELIATSRATTGKIDELTGNTDGFGNTADSVNSDNTTVASTAPITEILTPAIGLSLIKTGEDVSWTVAEESGVKEYHLINFTTGQTEVFSAGNFFYSTTVGENDEVKLIIIDNSGFSQTFMPEDGNIVKVAYDLIKGWNLIAMPGKNADTSAINSAFWGWNGSAYELIDVPAVGEAVWVYVQEASQVIISAEKVDSQLTLEPGWNMVGPTENMQIPPEAHTVYGWNDKYQEIATEEGILLQGVGYWIFSL